MLPILVASSNGRYGKTTIARQRAGHFALTEKRSLPVGADPGPVHTLA